MRILVVKLADIGDLLTATPALRGLRRFFPHAEITALVQPHCRELLVGTGLVDDVRSFAKSRYDAPAGVLHPDAWMPLAKMVGWLRGRHFDTVVLLHHLTTEWGTKKYAALAVASGAPVRAGLDNGRGGFLTHRVPDLGFGMRHEVEYCNDIVGLLGVPPDLGGLEFPLSEAEAAQARALLAGAPRPRVALHPGGGSFGAARRWPVERFAAVARQLRQQTGATIVLVGGPEERPLADAFKDAAPDGVLDLAGRTSLSELGAVLRECDLFVGSDSGVMHIAAAVGTSVVALFGPSNADAWGPWAPNASLPPVVLRSQLACQPCFYPRHGLGTPEGCPERTCLQLITPEQVVDVVGELLASAATAHYS